MIKSMTGFGRGEYRDDSRSIVAEVKSVNHRYADVNIRLPRRYNFAEEAIRQTVKRHVSRGKIEVNFTIEVFGDEDVSIELNQALATRYMEKLQELQTLSGLKEGVSLSYLASLPDVMTTTPAVGSEEAMEKAFTLAMEEALKAHSAMREKEGQKLVEDIIHRARLIGDMVEVIAARGPEMVKEYMDKLRERILELTNGVVTINEERLATEAAMFADKCNITEEIVRLRSHIAQLADSLEKGTAEGKKLDFLVQEMNREANTIGSKSNDLEITRIMLEIKGEIEKIREQIQNIE